MIPIRRTAFALLVAVLATAAPAALASTDQPDPLRIAIYDHTDGVAWAPKALMQILASDAGFACTRVSPEDIQNGMLVSGDFDALILPGGSGSGQAKRLGEDGAQNIKDFVAGGGGYVGICAGAYLASSHYTWSLNLINAKVLDTKHWNRGTGPTILDFTPEGRAALDQRSSQAEVYYGQGPLLAPGDHPDLPAYETLATYATEIAKKGAPTGVMIGTTAIARAPYGQGRVMLYSPHPEKKWGLHYLIVNGVRWAATEPADSTQQN
ncbi:MAG: BPL-N domain-containing protein [Planctomycetota bacterium]